MKKISLIILFISNIAHSDELILFQAVDKKISIELSLTLEQMQLVSNAKNSKNEIENLKQLIKRLDLAVAPIELGDALFLEKIEFYKHFLKFEEKSDISQVEKYIDMSEKMKEKGLREYSPFSRWFVLGVVDDLKKINFEKNPNQKKIKILIPWLNAFLNDERNQFEEKIYQTATVYITNLINILELYGNLNQYEIKNGSENLIHFQTKKIKIENNSKDLTTIIDGAIEDLITTQDETKAKKGTNKKSLPIPVDDWDFDF